MFDIKLKVDSGQIERLSGRFPAAARRAKVARITEALALLEREIKKDTPYGAGPIHLRDTIHGSVRASGSRATGVLGTPLEHGEPVELGTLPHFPPIGPIQFWVQRKLHIEGESESRAVAFLIARAISRRGTEGRRMFERNFAENKDRLVGILGKIPGDIIREV